MGLVHDRTGTQRDWYMIGLGHNRMVHERTRTQWDWYMIGLGHNGTGT